MNWLSAPPVMVPASTSRAPAHNTPTTMANTAKITTAVIAARALVRSTATSKEISTSFAKAARSTVSWVKACTVWTAFSVSLARALVSATVSWLLRLKVRIQRPNRISGIITSGTPASTSMVSFRLVKNSMISAPISITRLRNATDAEEPITVWIRVVSAVRRESTSPVRVCS